MLSKQQQGSVACPDLKHSITTLLEERLTTNCIDQDDPNLYHLVTSRFPQGCGYVVKKFNSKIFRLTIQHLIENDKFLCGGHNHSMCTSAIYLAVLMKLKKLKNPGKLIDERFNKWSTFPGPIWNYINDQARPDLMMTDLDIGTGISLKSEQLPNALWPKEGDLLQIWRKDYSGHSTIFAGYLKNSTGDKVGYCYWSSNLVTKGYGKSCELLSDIDRISVGRFHP